MVLNNPKPMNPPIIQGTADKSPHNVANAKKAPPNPVIGNWIILERSILPAKFGLAALSKLLKPVTKGNLNNCQTVNKIIHQITDPKIPPKIILAILFFRLKTISRPIPITAPMRILYAPGIPPNIAVGMEIILKIVK